MIPAAHLSPYHTITTKVGVPNKFDGTSGVQAKILATKLGTYIITNTHVFPNNRRKYVFALSYPTGSANRSAQLITHPESTAIFFETKKMAKAERAIQANK